MWGSAGVHLRTPAVPHIYKRPRYDLQKNDAILFADDSNLITNGNTIANLENTINNEIPILVQWLQTNRLSLNLKKTHIMVFGQSARQVDHQIKIQIEGETLEVVKHTKFLGLVLDNSLNWKIHTAQISSKIAKSVGIISRARQLLNAKILKQLYYSFLYPYLTYCIIIWGSSSDITLWPIFRIQKR